MGHETGKTYHVIEGNSYFDVDDVVVCIEQASDEIPKCERVSDGERAYISDSRLELIEENSEMSSNVFESIVQYAVAEESNTNAYKSLADTVVQGNIHTPDMFLDFVEDGEREYMESYHADNPDAKKKDGTYKYRTYLPKAYNTGKSVLKNALECGIPIMVEGEIVGKSALEKQIKESREGDSEEKSDYDKAVIVVGTLAKLYDKLPIGDKLAINTLLTDSVVDTMVAKI